MKSVKVHCNLRFVGKIKGIGQQDDNINGLLKKNPTPTDEMATCVRTSMNVIIV
jgi:hypothetical protein